MSTIRNGTSALFVSSGEPMYLFDRAGFANNIEELREAFTSYYRNTEIAYSFKTNYLKAACLTAGKCGCYAEVVSPYEYDYAKWLGYDDDEIVFNGVIPSDKKFDVLSAGGIVNVDCLAEYDRMEELAKYHKKHIKIGIRVNFDVSGHGSRFGVDVDGEEFRAIVNRISNSEFASLGGFHNHVHGTRAVQYWIERAGVLIKLAKQYGARYIDLGGGLWGKMPESLLSQFSVRPNTYAEYGKEIGRLFADEFPDSGVKLIIEPGIGLVGSVMDCVSHVVNIKEIRGKQYVQLDINGAATAFDYNCDANRITKPFHILRTGHQKAKHLSGADLVGTTCTEIDVLVRNFDGELAVGDTIIFENIGAYSLVTSRQFITPRLGVYDKVTGKCLRAPETSDDMFANYLNI